MIRNEDIIGKLFVTINELEDLIAIICPKVLYVYQMLDANNCHVIESIADRVRRNKVGYYNQWYISYHLRDRDDIRN